MHQTVVSKAVARSTSPQPNAGSGKQKAIVFFREYVSDRSVARWSPESLHARPRRRRIWIRNWMVAATALAAAKPDWTSQVPACGRYPKSSEMAGCDPSRRFAGLAQKRAWRSGERRCGASCRRCCQRLRASPHRVRSLVFGTCSAKTQPDGCPQLAIPALQLQPQEKCKKAWGASLTSAAPCGPAQVPAAIARQIHYAGHQVFRQRIFE